MIQCLQSLYLLFAALLVALFFVLGEAWREVVGAIYTWLTPATLALEAPYPNPFRTDATVALVLDRAATVAVEVFDVLGRRVATLHDGSLAAERHTFTLHGDGFPPGVYVVRAHGDGISATRSIVHVD